ncbi:MAG: undecaprenyl/decaprenyl-phosphate alpha-N-acetylglucosaminyl 1-phosphate transferase [Anaerolineae bacterium]|nr:undecaprenyl/decaprenyl-phosphate alpha-N-acetylglucosaminyl 1-phosphate transferase [Anaerolineae bacterium]
MLACLIAFTVALAQSLLLTPVMRRVALRLGCVHYPRPISIDTHVDPIPYLGGVSIFVAFATSSTLFASEVFPITPIILAATLLVLAGLVDDNKALNTPAKLIGQIGATIIVLVGGSGVLEVPHIFDNYVVNYTIAFLWIVGLINAINFLDIMDGLAGGVAAIATLGFVGVALWQDQPSLAIMATALAGGATGFLVFNFNPARIFMGDTGSQFLGFILALFPLMLLKEPGRVGGDKRIILASMVMLGVPLFEMVYTCTIRVLTGKLPWHGSKDHFALRSFAMGYSIRRIVLTTYAVGATLSLIGILQLYADSLWIFLTLFVIVASAGLVSVWLSRVQVPKPMSLSQDEKA